ncbi:dynamin family protein [Streptomyces sp. NBC_01210]|uniref:dynamin family protein n=1 Tax=Streptomyces sp. NBC_01210 TaxID=2903774 RepID=UPI002E0D5D90|nr:dynamin family protein [Streptomyces sp. NBC_01210]
MDNGPQPAVGTPPPPLTTAHVADVSGAAPGWLREARQLADEYRLDRIGAALEALAAERGRHAFRIAVVGEFNRGKSTLINRLICRDLLPTGRRPVTRAPVTVRAAQEESVRLTWPDGHHELRRLDAGDPWDGLTGTLPSPRSQEGMSQHPALPEPTVVAAVADAWLTELGTELVDLPGVNSGSEEQFEHVRRTAAASDAVLFVVSAVSPMSSTEYRLLQEEVLCRHVPFTAVVVTMMDLVDAEDHEETVRHLRQRLEGLPGRIPVVRAPVPGGGEPELAVLRSVVEGFARGSGRALWRDRRIAAQVADHCEAMTRIAAEAIAAGQLSRTEADERAKQAQTLLEKEEQQWEQLRIDLTVRQLALTTRLRAQIQKERDGLIERLRWELERSQDPGGWWERDLPFRLRHELSLLAQRSERTVLPGLTADTDWLDAEVAGRLPGASHSPAPAWLGPAVESRLSGEISDLSRTRLATRLGAQGGAIIGYMIALARSAPVPMIYGAGFSLIGGLLAEGAIRSATEQQRREVDAVLVRVVDDSTTAFLRQAVDLLSEIYADVFDRLRQSRLVWHDARRDALESPPGSGADWSDLAGPAAALAARIRAELQN